MQKNRRLEAVMTVFEKELRDLKCPCGRVVKQLRSFKGVVLVCRHISPIARVRNV